MQNLVFKWPISSGEQCECMLNTGGATYILQEAGLTGSSSHTLTGQMKGRQGHVMRMKGGQPVAVNGS